MISNFSVDFFLKSSWRYLLPSNHVLSSRLVNLSCYNLSSRSLEFALDHVWKNLHMIAHSWNLPWLVVGDFNDHVDSSEKRSFARGSSSSHSGTFINNINNCNLVDLGCSGPRLTWSNNRGGFANTLVRLDRALANPDWRLRFPEATVCNLPRSYSDHCPMIIRPEGNLNLIPRNNKKSPFRFIAD